jgi:hypothetical protein
VHAQQAQHPHLECTSSSLSLNLSSLSVASPTNLSPINAPSVSSALSPVTPLSPPPALQNPFGSHHHHLQQQQQQQQQQHAYQFANPDQNQNQSSQPQSQAHSPTQSHAHTLAHGQSQNQVVGRYDDHQQAPFEGRPLPTPAPSNSRSSSSSSSSMPRKRSFTSNSAAHSGSSSLASSSTGTLLEEPYDDASMDMGYEEMCSYPNGPNANGVGGGSPVDGDVSVDGGDDQNLGIGAGSGSTLVNGHTGGMGGGINVLGKPMGTNNFVTKLYQ